MQLPARVELQARQEFLIRIRMSETAYNSTWVVATRKFVSLQVSFLLREVPTTSSTFFKLVELRCRSRVGNEQIFHAVMAIAGLCLPFCFLNGVDRNGCLRKQSFSKSATTKNSIRPFHQAIPFSGSSWTCGAFPKAGLLKSLERTPRARTSTAVCSIADVTAENDAAEASIRPAEGEEAALPVSSAGDDQPDEVVRPSYDLAAEVSKRRNFAIISHPDAGKTTLTEKLLLYGGAIQEAGAVKARRDQRKATSDWMELEKARGISITSTALQFSTKGYVVNLLDTPGHQDFGEDTYRTLTAADNAVMLVDAAKGLEPQTRKLFAVCRMRSMPVFTIINKLDRPSLEPLELLEQITAEFGLACYPVNWPIGSGPRFKGVYHRPTKEVHLFERGDRTKVATQTVYSLDDPALPGLLEDLYEQLLEEVEVIEEITPPLDLQEVYAGKLTPVFFASAMTNFGVELFLESFLQYALPPAAYPMASGDTVAPDDPSFSGFVFKLQANMDPRHRDKVAFIRVCSGMFEKGMKVKHARTGKILALTRPQKMFAQERVSVDVGFAGDVLGLTGANFAIGDTIYCGSQKRSFPGIPSFSPEFFSYLKNMSPSKYKQFLKGVEELAGEGAVQVLYSQDETRQDPIIAAVGQLQFEVLQYRLENEYGVETQLDPLPFTVARWVLGGWPSVEKAGRMFNCAVVKDLYGRPVLLFKNNWNVDQLLTDNPKIGDLLPYGPPLTH
eukprot:jgi/Mesvir1/12764/Mv22826-RA.1